MMLTEKTWRRIVDTPTITITVAVPVEDEQREELDWSAWVDTGEPVGERQRAA